MAYRILIIEDNQDMRKAVASFLEDGGFKVKQVSSTEEGIDEVDENEFDLALVDINLPGKSGFEMIRYIREEGHDMRVIALTARDAVEDKLRGFDLGINDYVVKPFNLSELKARITAHIKNAAKPSSDEVITTDNFSLNPKNLEFVAKGKRIGLTQLEFRMMQLLMRNNHSLVKIDDLIEHAWGEESAVINPPIRIHIANLRRKIGDRDFKIIRTVPGTGYIFNDPLK